MLRCPYSSIHSRLTVPSTSRNGAATAPDHGCTGGWASVMSVTGPRRRALLHDRRDPFGGVVTVIDAPVHREVGLAHDAKRVALRRALRRVVDLLDRLQRQRGARRDP